MTVARFNLLVIRSADAERAVAFYEALGLKFVRHSHGLGPEHFAHEEPEFVFEIYPLTGRAAATTSTRLGLRIDFLDIAIDSLLSVGGKVVSPPQKSPWGRRAVVADVDGHRVELIDNSAA